MIISFGNSLAQLIFEDQQRTVARQFPPELYQIARRKMFYLHEAENLIDLKVPPGNRLEALKGKWKGFYSIRINDQWRIAFKWQGNLALQVTILDYHK